MVHLRRRGTAIVDTPKGILVASESGRSYLLPGGNARRSESRRRAMIRELREETSLKVIDCTYLFEYISGNSHKDWKGGYFRTAHKVFSVKTVGDARPCGEIKRIEYVSSPSATELTLSHSSKEIIKKYHSLKHEVKKTWECTYCGTANQDNRCSFCGAPQKLI